MANPRIVNNQLSMSRLTEPFPGIVIAFVIRHSPHLARDNASGAEIPSKPCRTYRSTWHKAGGSIRQAHRDGEVLVLISVNRDSQTDRAVEEIERSLAVTRHRPCLRALRLGEIGFREECRRAFVGKYVCADKQEGCNSYKGSKVFHSISNLPI